jgi:hypothetical protein
MITTSTVIIYTGVAPRWLPRPGHYRSFYLNWSFLCVPAMGVSDQRLYSEGQHPPALSASHQT